MNQILQIAVLALLFSPQGATNPVATAGVTDSQILQTVKEFDMAWDRKDVAAVERFLSSQYVYFTSEGKVMSRANLIELLRSPKYLLKASERSELEVFLTRNTAVVSSRWKGHGTYDDRPFTDDQRCSLVLIRHGKTWKFLSEHCTQITAAN